MKLRKKVKAYVIVISMDIQKEKKKSHFVTSNTFTWAIYLTN